MATVKKITYGTNNWDPDTATLKAFLDSLNCSLIETELLSEYNLLITIDDIISLKYYGYGNPGAKISIIINGVETDITNIGGAYGSKTIIVVCSDDFIYIDYTDRSGCLYFCYEKINNENYYGYNTNSGALLSDITLINMENNTQYKHGARLNYEYDVGYLEYAPDILFNELGTQRKLDDPNFIACTTVTAKQVITFNGKNYYSLSANVLVQMDD